MNKIKGVSEKQLFIIKQILFGYPEIDFYFYGSRVNGDFSPNSDLDVLARGKSKLSLDLLEKLQDKFDKSDLPFIVHIADFYELDKDFWNLIKGSIKKVK